MATVGELLVKITGDNSGLDKAIKQSTQDSKNFAKEVAGSMATAAAAAAAVAGAVAGIKFNADIEDFVAAFTPLTGGAENATKMIAALNKEAASTPFELTQIAGTAKQLLPILGNDIGKVTETFRMLGDTAGGNAEKLDSITRGYVKVMNTGKVSMEALNMISDAGVPIQKLLADSMGKSVEEMYKLSSSGKISSEELTKAFQKMTAEGGIFFNGMNLASQTFNGIMSTLADNTKQGLGGIMSGAMGPLKEVMLFLSETIPDVSKQLEPLGNTLGAGISASGAVIQTIAMVLKTVPGELTSIAAGVIAVAAAAKLLGVSLGPVGVAIAIAGTAALVLEGSLKKSAETANKIKFGDIAKNVEWAATNTEKFYENATKVESAFKAGTKASSITMENINRLARATKLSADNVLTIGINSKNVNDDVKEVLKGLYEQNTAEVMTSAALVNGYKNASQASQTLKKDIDNTTASSADLLAKIKAQNMLVEVGEQTLATAIEKKIKLRKDEIEKIVETGTEAGTANDAIEASVNFQRAEIAKLQTQLDNINKTEKERADALAYTAFQIVDGYRAQALAVRDTSNESETANTEIQGFAKSTADQIVAGYRAQALASTIYYEVDKTNEEGRQQRIDLGIQITKGATDSMFKFFDAISGDKSKIATDAMAGLSGVFSALISQNYAGAAVSAISTAAAIMGDVIADAQKRAEELRKFTDEWATKADSPMEKLSRERDDAIEKAARLGASEKTLGDITSYYAGERTKYYAQLVTSASDYYKQWAGKSMSATQLLEQEAAAAKKKAGEYKVAADQEALTANNLLDSKITTYLKNKEALEAMTDAARAAYVATFEMGAKSSAATNWDNKRNALITTTKTAKTQLDQQVKDTQNALDAQAANKELYEKTIISIDKDYATQKAAIEKKAIDDAKALAKQEIEDRKTTLLESMTAMDKAMYEKVQSFYESFSGIGTSIADALTNGFTTGLGKADFMSTMKEKITSMAVQSAVLAIGMQEQMVAIGEKISNAVRTGITSTAGQSILETVKSDLSALYTTAEATINPLLATINQVFDTGSVPKTKEDVGQSSVNGVVKKTSTANNINVNINSPVALSPAEASAAARLEMEKMAFAGAFA